MIEKTQIVYESQAKRLQSILKSCTNLRMTIIEDNQCYLVRVSFNSITLGVSFFTFRINKKDFLHEFKLRKDPSFLDRLIAYFKRK